MSSTYEKTDPMSPPASNVTNSVKCRVLNTHREVQHPIVEIEHPVYKAGPESMRQRTKSSIEIQLDLKFRAECPSVKTQLSQTTCHTDCCIPFNDAREKG